MKRISLRSICLALAVLLLAQLPIATAAETVSNDTCLDDNGNSTAHQVDSGSHHCSVCGEQVTECGIRYIIYGNSKIPVRNQQLAALKSTTYVQRASVEIAMGLLDFCAKTADELSANVFNVVFSSQGFREFLSKALDVDISELDHKLREFFAGTEYNQEEVAANAVVLYASTLLCEMDKGDIFELLSRRDTYSIIRRNLNSEENASLGLAQVAAAYGMFVAYAYDRGDHSLIEKLENASFFVNQIGTEGYIEFVNRDQAKQDLDGLIAALDILNSTVGAETVLVNGSYFPDGGSDDLLGDIPSLDLTVPSSWDQLIENNADFRQFVSSTLGVPESQINDKLNELAENDPEKRKTIQSNFLTLYLSDPKQTNSEPDSGSQTDLLGPSVFFEVIGTGGDNARSAVENLFLNGFSAPDLVKLVEKGLNSYSHLCQVCGKKLTDCILIEISCEEPTCTSTGFIEEYCILCSTSTKTETSALGHIFSEYRADGKGLKISNCERNCGATDSKVDENYQSGNIEISPEEDENENQDKVTIGKELLEEILNAHKEFGLHFIGELLDLLFDCDALDAIKDMIENAPDISIVVQNRTDKPDGHKPNKLRFDISLQIGEALQSNTDFGSGSVTVTIPLDELQLTEKQNVKVYHIKGDTRTEMKSERHGNKVSFKTSHFSEYEVVVDTCADHNYENGVCTVCGAEQDDGLFALAGTNLRLGEDLTIFFYVNKSDLSGEDYYAQIRRTYSDGKTDEIITIPYSAWESYNDSLMRFGYEGLPAAAMADELYITIYKADGTAVSSEKEDSIQMYAMRQIGGANTSAKVNTLLVDMLNYGAAAQEFFKYNTAELANADLTETQQNLYATKTADAVDHREKGTNYIGSTLILASRIEFTFYFTNLSRDMYAEVEYIDIYNKTQKMTIPGSEFITNSGYLGVNINGLPAGDGKQLISCTVYDKNGNPIAEAKDSVEGYIARMSEQDKLYTMVMRFVVSSKAYFGK